MLLIVCMAQHYAWKYVVHAAGGTTAASNSWETASSSFLDAEQSAWLQTLGPATQHVQPTGLWLCRSDLHVV